MKLPFRQGIVNCRVDGFGNPRFLLTSSTPNYVALNAAPTSCVVTFAHGTSNYLQVFDTDVPAAWGPIPPASTSYLYWDIDLLTAAVSTGLTTIDPIVSATEPASPTAPTATAVVHWFDTTTNTMKIWTGAKWRVVVRAFAGQVIASEARIVSEQKAVSWRGVLPVEGKAGYIATDMFGNPIRSNNGEFVTTASDVRFNTTVGRTGVLAVLPNAFVPVRASENIPAFSLVYFSGSGTVGLASGNPAVIPSRPPIGIVQDELSINEVGAVTQNGEISADVWDWSDHIGKPLYCGDNGQIVRSRPPGLIAYRVGFVKDAKTILFQVDSETLPQAGGSESSVIVNGTSPLTSSLSVNGLGESVWTVALPPATTTSAGHMTTTQVTQLQTLGTRVTQAETDILNRALLSHTHAISDVVNLGPALNSKLNVPTSTTSGNLPVFAAGGQLANSSFSPASFALATHTHAISQIIGLQLELDGKAPTVHQHNVNQLLPSGQPGQVVTMTSASSVGWAKPYTLVPTDDVTVGTLAPTASLILRSRIVDMQYFAEYDLAAAGYGAALGGDWDPSSTEPPVGSLPAAVTITEPRRIKFSSNLATQGGIIGTVNKVSSPFQVIELQVVEVPQPGSDRAFFVGVYDPTVAPYNFAVPGGGGAGTFWAQRSDSNVSNGRNNSGVIIGPLPQWQVGDRLGLLFRNTTSTLILFHNGIQVATLNTAPATPVQDQTFFVAGFETLV